MRRNNNNKEDTKVKKIKKTKGKHKKKMLRVLVYIVLVTFMLSLFFLIGFGIYYFRTSPKYKITNINFKGNSRYTKEELYEKTESVLGDNLFKISKKNIENYLSEFPYIESIKINKKIPDTLNIIITEFTSKYFAYNIENDMYYRLNKDGIILEQAKGEEKEDSELLVFGISFDDEVKLKEKIAHTEIQKIQKFEEIYEIYLMKNIDKKITNIEFKNENVILTLDFEINVIMNNEDIEYNIAFLKSILENLTNNSGTIDMTKPNPVYTETIR